MREWRYSFRLSLPRHTIDMNGQFQAPAALSRGSSPSTQLVGDLMSHRGGTDSVEKRDALPGIEPWLLYCQPLNLIIILTELSLFGCYACFLDLH
jgi:hypothetical protein